MLYRPAFCCNCGEKIQRDQWRVWTSRRFCPLCETEHKGIDLLPRVIIGFGLIMTVFGFAEYVRRPPREAKNEDVFRSSQFRSELKSAPKLNEGTSNANVQSNSTIPANFANASQTQLNEQPKQEKTTSDETVYYCGAITKRGTPCTRRVKTKGFCWQHARSGQVAPARF